MIPSLRERKGDVMPLFAKFLKELEYKSKVEADVKAQLLRYDWPGNVRELRNAAQRYALLETLQLDEPSQELTEWESGVISLREIQQRVEEEVIEMLIRAGHNKTEVAQLLGISRTALWKKLK